MRSARVAPWGLAAVVVVLPACTLDYEGLLDASGDGGASASSSASTTVTTDAATTTSSAATTSTDASSSSSAGGAGGAAQASSSSAGGSGGQGGAPPIEPCPTLAVSFEAGLLADALEGSAWLEDESGGGSLTTDSGRLEVDVNGDGNNNAESGEIRTMEAELFACSVTVELDEVSVNGSVDTSATAYVSAVGDWGGVERYEGIEVVVLPNDVCEIGSRLRGDEGWEGDSVPCQLYQPGVLLRLTHTGTELCHDVSTDDGASFQKLHCWPTTKTYRVAIGATTVEDVKFYFGPVN